MVHRNETATSLDRYFIQKKKKTLKPLGDEQKAFLFSPPLLGLREISTAFGGGVKVNCLPLGRTGGTPELKTPH